MLRRSALIALSNTHLGHQQQGRVSRVAAHPANNALAQALLHRALSSSLSSSPHCALGFVEAARAVAMLSDPFDGPHHRDGHAVTNQHYGHNTDRPSGGIPPSSPHFLLVRDEAHALLAEHPFLADPDGRAPQPPAAVSASASSCSALSVSSSSSSSPPSFSSSSSSSSPNFITSREATLLHRRMLGALEEHLGVSGGSRRRRQRQRQWTGQEGGTSNHHAHAADGDGDGNDGDDSAMPSANRSAPPLPLLHHSTGRRVRGQALAPLPPQSRGGEEGWDDGGALDAHHHDHQHSIALSLVGGAKRGVLFTRSGGGRGGGASYHTNDNGLHLLLSHSSVTAEGIKGSFDRGGRGRRVAAAALHEPFQLNTRTTTLGDRDGGAELSPSTYSSATVVGRRKGLGMGEVAHGEGPTRTEEATEALSVLLLKVTRVLELCGIAKKLAVLPPNQLPETVSIKLKTFPYRYRYEQQQQQQQLGLATHRDGGLGRGHPHHHPHHEYPSRTIYLHVVPWDRYHARVALLSGSDAQLAQMHSAAEARGLDLSYEGGLAAVNAAGPAAEAGGEWEGGGASDPAIINMRAVPRAICCESEEEFFALLGLANPFVL